MDASSFFCVQSLEKKLLLNIILTTITVTQINPTTISQAVSPIAKIALLDTMAINGIISAIETIARAKR